MQFPTLSSTDVGLLSIPASSASSESAFSTTGNILEMKCNRLSAATVSRLRVLNSASQGSLKKLLRS